MTMQEVYELLIERKQVHLPDVVAKEVESLRVMLVKKWNIHKERLDNLGWLDEDTKKLAVCLREAKAVDETLTGVMFLLQERKKSTVSYTVLIPQNSQEL